MGGGPRAVGNSSAVCGELPGRILVAFIEVVVEEEEEEQ